MVNVIYGNWKANIVVVRIHTLPYVLSEKQAVVLENDDP